MIQKRYLSWHELETLVRALAAQLDDRYDGMLVITRGGMIPAALISQLRNWRNILVAAVQFYTGIDETLEVPLFLQFPSDPLVHGKRLLVVDDVWDSGRTIAAVKARLLAAGAIPEVAVLHFKPARSRVPGQPDYFVEQTDEWIVYPWDLPARDADGAGR
jgi:hypoxanthine phosphoribosyltransferase